MPTAEDYRSGISDIEAVIDRIAAARRSCESFADDVGMVGHVGELVERALVANASNGVDVTNRVDVLLAEMDRRARLCDQFTADMAAYASDHAAWSAADRVYRTAPPAERETLWPGREPQPPRPPFAGAEVSS